MMKEEYVTYEQSQALKRLGFKEETTHYYVNFKSYGEVKLWSCNPPENHNARLSINEVCSAPRLDQAQKWLREVKGVLVEPHFQYGTIFKVVIQSETKYLYKILEKGFNSYELALSAGIDAALELLTFNTK
ncbi:MAG: hypothetical protein HDS16_04885 [Bacteroides sp.]|nr:hypothetical protein [Bacteroides sp.]